MLGPLSEVILEVEDMAAQTAFYRDVLGLEPTFESEFWTTFATGACALALHGGGKGGEGARLVFDVDDVKAARAWLSERGVPVGDVREPAPGVLVVDARDPEGNVFHVESRR